MEGFNIEFQNLMLVRICCSVILSLGFLGWKKLGLGYPPIISFSLSTYEKFWVNHIIVDCSLYFLWSCLLWNVYLLQNLRKSIPSENRIDLLQKKEFQWLKELKLMLCKRQPSRQTFENGSELQRWCKVNSGNYPSMSHMTNM